MIGKELPSSPWSFSNMMLTVRTFSCRITWSLLGEHENPESTANIACASLPSAPTAGAVASTTVGGTDGACLSQPVSTAIEKAKSIEFFIIILSYSQPLLLWRGAGSDVAR
jgi:hypothetical protein